LHFELDDPRVGIEAVETVRARGIGRNWLPAVAGITRVEPKSPESMSISPSEITDSPSIYDSSPQQSGQVEQSSTQHAWRQMEQISNTSGVVSQRNRLPCRHDRNEAIRTPG
jgi:hypothetical protein